MAVGQTLCGKPIITPGTAPLPSHTHSTNPLHSNNRRLQPLMDFLGDRKGLACKISGKASSGEASSTMGEFRSKLADRTRTDKPQKDSPGTFFLDTASGQADVRVDSFPVVLLTSRSVVVFRADGSRREGRCLKSHRA